MVYAENKDNSNTVRRRLQAVAALADKSGEEMPEGRGIAEENVLTFLYEGKMMELVDDETAGNGRALKLKNNDSGGWYTQLPLSEVAFDEGVKYRLRIRVRAKKIGEAAGKGFGAGVYDPVKKKGVKYTYYDLKDLSGDYAWYEILEWKPEKTQYICIAPGMFDKKKYKHHPGHDGIFVDALEISKCAQ
jgi:hypothetical protein